MRGLWAFLFLFATSASAAPGAPSQTAAARAERPVPQSIWRLDGVQFEHLQSGLRCPAMVEGWSRNGLINYDAYGFDVSCGYNSQRDHAAITLYLTRGVSVDAAYADAKRVLPQHGAVRNAKLLGEGAMPLGGMEWRKASYAGDGGMRSDIWMTDLSGWMFEFRATYPSTSEGAVAAQIESLTRLTMGTAGERLRLCARSAEPARPGTVLADPKRLAKLALMGAIVGGGAAQAEREKAAEAPQPAIVYCAERPVAGAEHPVLAWRGVAPHGGDARIDRVTPMTLGPPLALEVGLDSAGSLVNAETEGRTGARAPDLWMASIRRDAGSAIFGYFEGRPSPKLTGDLLLRIMDGKVKPLSAYSTDGKKVTVTISP